VLPAAGGYKIVLHKTLQKEIHRCHIRQMERRLITEDKLVHNRVIISQFSQELATEVIPHHFARGFQLLQNP
jgi:hypothetical protein